MGDKLRICGKRIVYRVLEYGKLWMGRSEMSKGDTSIYVLQFINKSSKYWKNKAFHWSRKEALQEKVRLSVLNDNVATYRVVRFVGVE